MNTLELIKRDTGTTSYRRKTVTLPTYDVLLNGQHIGQVARRMITRERRTPGNRYVNARWSSPGWKYGKPGQSGWECASRRDGIARLLRDEAGLSWAESEALAVTVRSVR